MKKLIAAICFVALAAPGAFAQDKSKSADKKAPPAAEKRVAKSGASAKQKAQQQKMKSCNKQAGEKKLKGSDRKKFMSACLKG